MAVGEGNVFASRAMVVAGVGIVVVLQGGVFAVGIVAVVEDPNFRGRSMLTMEVVLREGSVDELIGVRGDEA